MCLFWRKPGLCILPSLSLCHQNFIFSSSSLLLSTFSSLPPSGQLTVRSSTLLWRLSFISQDMTLFQWLLLIMSLYRYLNNHPHHFSITPPYLYSSPKHPIQLVSIPPPILYLLRPQRSLSSITASHFTASTTTVIPTFFLFLQPFSFFLINSFGLGRVSCCSLASAYNFINSLTIFISPR